MALKAGYYGVKKNIMEKLAQLDGAKIIKSVGAGLNLSSQGALSCKSATASQAGIAKSSDYLPQALSEEYPLVWGVDPETELKTTIAVDFDTTPTNNTGDTANKLITSKGVYDALQTKITNNLTPLTSSNDLDDLKDTGFYSCKGSAPAHSPDGGGWFVLQVLHIADAQVDTMQLLYKGVKHYQRYYGGSPATWGPWYVFEGTQVQ